MLPSASPYRSPPFVPAQPQRLPAPASAPRAAVPAPARPLVRAKGPDEPAPRLAPLLMPSPEQLGVTVRTSESGPDWSAIQARIKELGVVSFHMDSAADGRYRFTCWVPRGQPGITQRIEALAATEAEAVRLGLERAGQARTPPETPKSNAGAEKVLHWR